MTPVLRATLALVGVITAGLPLLWLTAPAPNRVEPLPPTAATKAKQVNASLYFSGEPIKITLFHEAVEIAVFQAPKTPCHFALELPMVDTTEIEYEVEWPENTPGMKGVTLYLEPDGLESQAQTMWSMPEDTKLYDIFYFKW